VYVPSVLILTFLDPVVIMYTSHLKSQQTLHCTHRVHVCVLCPFQNTHNSNISHNWQPISLRNAPRLWSVDPYTMGYINACLPVGQPAVHTSNPVVLTRHFTLSPPSLPTSSTCSCLALYCLPYSRLSNIISLCKLYVCSTQSPATVYKKQSTRYFPYDVTTTQFLYS